MISILEGVRGIVVVEATCYKPEDHGFENGEVIEIY
jgi:hypothetical protein